MGHELPPQELRHQAEAMIPADAVPPTDAAASLSSEAVERALHDMRVHQIELEQQNEELRRMQVELDASRARYFDLYDLAPVGYCTLSDQGLILETNLTAATLLGVARTALVSQPFSRFVFEDDQDVYYLHRKQVFEAHSAGSLGRQGSGGQAGQASAAPTCDLRVVTADGTQIWTHIDATVSQDAAGAPVCRMMLSNITDRKRTEAALRESELKYRSIIESSSDAIFAVDEHGQYQFANQLFASTLGHSPDYFVGKTFWDVYPKEHADYRFEATRRVVETGESESLEVEVPLPTGSLFFHATANPIRDDTGKVAMVLTHATDITERKRTEEALREVEERFQQLFDHMADGVAVYRGVDDGQDFVFVDINAPGQSLSRIGLDDAVGRRITEVFPAAERIGLLDALRRVWRTGQAETLPLKEYADERIVQWVENYVYRLPSGLIVAVYSDTTEKRLAEEAKTEEQKFSKTMIDSIPGTFYMLDAEGCYVRWNAYQRDEIVGKPEDQMAGVTAIDTIHPDDREMVGSKIESILRNGSSEVVAGRVLLRGGPEFRWMLMTGRSIVIRGKPFLLGIGIDISDQRAAEEEGSRLQGQLQQAQKMESVGRLAGGVAHDFNNMLGVILGHTEMALEQVDTGQPLRADLEEIRKAATRSADLTRQLLAFARKQTIAPTALDLNDTVENMLTMLRRLIGEDIRLAWLPGKDVWPVLMDPCQLDQILANLCVNARDAISGVGHLTIDTGTVVFDEVYCADHAGFVPGDYVRLAVSDDGCGMDPETLTQVFEPFFTTKAFGQGTGLGLATVYGIVKQNNGFINAYSEPAHGTTFTIYLPRHVGKTEHVQTEGALEPATRGHETILLVEDEPAILTLTTRMLERQGYTVIAAHTPGEAMHAARAYDGEIHLLMTDVVMPEMNGRDLARNVLVLYPQVKRLFMSGYTANVIAHHGHLEDGVHFIQKPFSIKDLAAKVRGALDRA